jgi:hypothetical protein
MRRKILTLMGWIAFIVAVIVAERVIEEYRSQQAIKSLSKQLLKGMDEIDGGR